ncbi:serine/arginine repetitive matrix protein 1 isoform X2 [Pectinophora gossypiella]|uniref:serine/arginine repetitive matrix protein 1 isoform X2 n=1 Tax=Pectinophora gossypiella TaxID=13191 RepID=UPI00214EFC97|nr:serine/arginine repetitive matrix protein 1 isoform X2 [Pectinophora gossypiella]
MANEEVLGPRKTMFVLVIVVGCFAVLWPRILSPLLLGGTRDSLKPNQFDRDAGCCEVLFETEVQVLEVLNEVCNYAVSTDGKLSPYAAAECRKAVNETCGVDIAAFLKRTENVGKTTKMLLDTMKSSNSSCLKEHFGVPVMSLSTHNGFNSWTLEDTMKQERPPLRGGPHPALRERGRAIPAGAPPPPAPRPAPLPPHVRVRSSPLAVYFDVDIKPPPIPGMRPPMGGAGGPVPAPKSSMGFVMPIYTICIIVFFVYTLSKILFKRTGTTTYEHISPDPQFRRRVFRDDSRQSPDKLVVTAISGLVAEVQQQMEASYAQNQQRQDVQDNHARPYTNGTVIHSGPVQIVASEYREPSKDKSPEPQKEPTPEPVPEPKEPSPESSPEPKEASPEPKEASPEPKEASPEPKEASPESKEASPEPKEASPEPKEASPEPKEASPEPKEASPEPKEASPEPKEASPEPKEASLEPKEPAPEPKEQTPEVKEDHGEREKVPDRETERDPTEELIKLTEKVEEKTGSLAKLTNEFLDVEKNRVLTTPEKQSTPDLLEEALKEDSPAKEEEEEEGEVEEVEEVEEPEKSSVKVVGMETTAHTADGGAWPRDQAPPLTPLPPQPHAQPAEEVKSIFLETEIPQQSRVLVADFVDRANPPHHRHSPTVVSGKMTLSLIQDEPRDTPERDLESTFDDFTTASGVTQPAAEKEDNLSDEEIEEEIEVEEIEEEVEVEEDEEEEEPQPKKEK